MIITLSWFVIVLLIFQFAGGLFRFRYYWKDYRSPLNKSIPKVSVLVAARNESEDLPVLLNSLEGLNYPKEKIQFLFVNDQSEDNTESLLKEWCKDRENADWLTILPEEAFSLNQNPKANALAILEKRAEGDFYFLTDADCSVPQNWIMEMVSCFDKSTGMILGITRVDSKKWLSAFQEMDWWNALGFVKVVTDFGFSTTGLGNNMVVSKEAFVNSGGFEELEFSLTEDLELCKAVRNAGYKVVHQVSEGVLVSTKAERSFSELLKQRKRWMSGVMTLPWYWKIILGLQFLYFPAVLVLVCSLGTSVLLIAVFKMIIQSLFLHSFARKSAQSISKEHSLLFDFYFLPITLLTILYYFWPSQTEWKSRKYQ